MMQTEYFWLDIGTRSQYESGTRVRLYAYFCEWAIVMSEKESEYKLVRYKQW